MALSGERSHPPEQPLLQANRYSFEPLANAGPAPFSFSPIPLFALGRRQRSRLIGNKVLVELLGCVSEFIRCHFPVSFLFPRLVRRNRRFSRSVNGRAWLP